MHLFFFVMHTSKLLSHVLERSVGRVFKIQPIPKKIKINEILRFSLNFLGFIEVLEGFGDIS